MQTIISTYDNDYSYYTNNNYYNVLNLKKGDVGSRYYES